MARPVTRLVSAFASTLLGISLALVSVPQARAEDAADPTPSPAAATTVAPGDLATPPSDVGSPAPMPESSAVATTEGDESDPGADPRHGGPTLTKIAPGLSPGERTRAGRISLAADEEPEPEPAESVYGWVWDGYSYDIVEGIDVKIWRTGDINNAPAATAVTDSDGYYSFSGLAPGEYVLWFGGDGFIEEWWDDTIWGSSGATVLTIADGEPVEANAELDPWGTITGTVTDSRGKSVVGRWMTLFHWDDTDEYWQESEAFTTDSSGRFTFPDLRPGSYAVDDSELPKGARMKLEGRFVSLLSYSGSSTGGLLAPWVRGAPGTGISQKAEHGSGSWKKTTFSYQWLRDGTSIPKATKQTYTPVTADIGGQLQVRVTSRQGNNSFTVTSPTTWPIIETSAPVIKGSVAAGGQVIANDGAWQAETVFSYQWFADGKAISGAKDSSFTLTGSQKGKRITVKVTGQFGDYPAITRTSAATAKVATAGTPTVSGARVVGSTLKAKPGTWTKKTKFSYQWLRDGAVIPKATKSSYKLTSADAGKLVTVRVTGKRSGYATVQKTSAVPVKVLAAGTPSISGAAGTGMVMTAKPGTWSPGTVFTYQWYANGTAFTDASTDFTVVLTSSQRSKRISVKVTGRLDGHATASKTSKSTAKVLSVGTVTTSGTLVVGSTLTAKPGSWTKKTKLSYQWLRDGVVIPKATKTSYRLVPADAGHALSVRVTGKLSGHATVSAVSVAGAPVQPASDPVTGG